MELKKFEDWLRGEGRSAGTVAAYVSAVRCAIRALGVSGLSSVALDDYAMRLASGPPRGAFRSAWRAFVRFAASEGVEMANVSPGRAGRPSLPRTVASRAENHAIAYLARAIPLERLGDLRWTDVEFVSAADAVISDPPLRRRYHVHRRALDVLLAWARPDGKPIGALVPDAPSGRTWMRRDVMEERVEAANDAANSGTPLADPTAAFLASLPAPRVEALATR